MVANYAILVMHMADIPQPQTTDPKQGKKELGDEAILVSPKTLSPKPTSPIIPIPVPTPSTKLDKRVYILLAIILLGAGLAFLYFYYLRDVFKPIQQPVTEEMQGPVDVAPKKQTYRSEEYGFEFEFANVFVIPPAKAFPDVVHIYQQDFHFSAFGRDAYGGLVSLIVSRTDNALSYVLQYVDETEVQETSSSLGTLSTSIEGEIAETQTQEGILEMVSIFQVGDNFVELKYQVSNDIDLQTYDMQKAVYKDMVSSFRLLDEQPVETE